MQTYRRVDTSSSAPLARPGRLPSRTPEARPAADSCSAGTRDAPALRRHPKSIEGVWERVWVPVVTIGFTGMGGHRALIGPSLDFEKGKTARQSRRLHHAVQHQSHLPSGIAWPQRWRRQRRQRRWRRWVVVFPRERRLETSRSRLCSVSPPIPRPHRLHRLHRGTPGRTHLARRGWSDTPNPERAVHDRHRWPARRSTQSHPRQGRWQVHVPRARPRSRP